MVKVIKSGNVSDLHVPGEDDPGALLPEPDQGALVPHQAGQPHLT